LCVIVAHGLVKKRKKRRKTADAWAGVKLLVLGAACHPRWSLLNGILLIIEVGVEVTTMSVGAVSSLGGGAALVGQESWTESCRGQLIRGGHEWCIGQVGLLLVFRGAAKSNG